MKAKKAYKFLNKEFLLIIIFAIILRLIFLIRDQSFWWDEAVYLSMADAFSGNFYFFEYFRPPLLSFLLSVLQATSLWAAKLFSTMISIFTIVVAYYFSKKIWDKEKAILITFFFAINHFALLYSVKALAESLTIFLLTLIIFIFYLGFRNNSKALMALSGFLIGLALMTRHLSAYIVFPILLFAIIAEKIRFLKDPKYYLLAFSVLVAMSPWLIFNYLEFGNPFWPQVVNAEMGVSEPWFFYFLSLPLFLSIQAIMILFAIPSIKRDRLVLLNFMILAIGFFVLSIISHKEIRYLVAILPSIIVLEGIGLHNLISKYKISFESCTRAVYILLVLFSVYLFLFLPVQKEDTLYQCAEKINAMSNETMSTTMSPFFSYLLKRPFSQLPWSADEFSCQNLLGSGVNYTVYYSRGWYYPLEDDFMNKTRDCTVLLYNITNNQKCLIYKIVNQS